MPQKIKCLSFYITLTKRNLHLFHDPITDAEPSYGTAPTLALREENHEGLY